MRDLFKTIGAILVIGLIVVATFLYGNKQRQNQLRQTQQTDQQGSGPKVTVDSTRDNTQVKPENAKPTAPAPAQNGQNSNNVGGGQLAGGGETPKTGGEVLFLVPLALMTGLYQWNKRSRHNLRQAMLRAHK